jgi:hypothetical protein
MTSNGHTAMKLGGGNHSGDCGGNDDLKEDGECCCWYDIGIRANGDIQTQIERPHPDNTDVDCDDCTMSNIGMSMNNHWIGLKHIVYPENENGDVNHGGIRIKFYISTDAIVNGVPTNEWKLVFNTLDTGQWLDDYEWPAYQELEMRLSNIESLNDLEMYKDRVFIRRWIRGGGGGTGTGTGRITYHGGRIMKTPTVNLIFWGSDWDDRTEAPTKNDLVVAVRDKLFNTDKAFFNNLFQYGGIQYPVFGQAVTNTTHPIPDAARIEADTARLVINDTIERALLPQNTDFNNTIYIVFCPLDKVIYHASNNVEPDATHNSYKPTLTVSDTGGVDEPTDTVVVQFAFTLKRDINIYNTTSCSLTDPTDPGGGGDPGGGTGGSSGGTGLSKIYEVTNVAEDRELSSDSSFDNRTRAAEKVNSSTAPIKGIIPHQADFLLNKVGTPATTNSVHAKIWDSGDNVIYTSPTNINPDSGLSSSAAFVAFDFSTNTRALQVGDRIGVEWLGGTNDDDAYVEFSYDTSEGTGSSGTYQQNYEDGTWENQTGRRLCARIWD